jgi:hypothetical protein
VPYSKGFKQRRMGYMGHLSLIAEEVVKLFAHYPEQFYQRVLSGPPKQEWEDYVFKVLREQREVDTLQLGGGVASIPHDLVSTASGPSDEDDEFPMSARAVKSRSDFSQHGNSPTIESSSPPSHPPNAVGLFDKMSPSDQVGRTLYQRHAAEVRIVRSVPGVADVKRVAGQELG